MYEVEAEQQKQNDYRRAQRGYPLGGSIGSGVMAATATQAPMSPILSRVEELTRNVEELHGCIGQLESRLSMALTPNAPSPPQVAGNSERERADGTRLGSIVAELAAKVRSAIYRISDITQRVEL